MKRREFLFGLGVAGASALNPARAAESILQNIGIRGSIDAAELGFRPDTLDDQSKIFSKLLAAASKSNQEIYLPPGDYIVSNLTLPKRVRIHGVPGASRIIYGGDGHLFAAEDTELVEIEGVVFDGANRGLNEQSQGLLEGRRVPRFILSNCEIIGSEKNGISLEGCAGRIEKSTISGAGDAGIWSVEGAGMTIADNEVRDCANGGILVHRWQEAHDGTMITGNRVSRIGAKNGGTGQFGNGINVFRGNDVTASGNLVSDCAFSAIRFNSASDVQIVNNNCKNSGETAIYSEFKFEGSLISGNVVDGAANGISVANFNEGGRLSVVANNIVRNLKLDGPYPADAAGFGIGIAVEADTVVSGNVIENAPNIGLNIGWGPYMRDVSATGNIIRKCGEGIAITVVEGAGKAVINSNVLSENIRGAIFGHRWTDVVTSDMATSGNQGFETLTVENNQAA